MNDPDEQRLTALLRHAEPAPLPADTTEFVLARAWETVQAGIGREPDQGDGDRTGMSARRRRLLTRSTALATAVLLAGAGTAAAGTWISTRTGQHTTGRDVDTAGAGELLNMKGTDRVPVIRALIADIPFAPGYESKKAQEPVDGSLQDTTPPGESGSQISEEAVRSQAAQDAVCTWADAWVAADDRGDRAARDAVTAAIAGSLQWKAIHDVDPHPSPTGYVGDQGVGTPTRFGWVPAIVTATRDGGRRAVLDAVFAAHSCGADYAPVINATPGYPGAEK